MNVFSIIKDNLGICDWIIILCALVNIGFWLVVNAYTNKLYKHFNPHDRVRNLSESGKSHLLKSTRRQMGLTDEELLEARENMNKYYAIYANVTTIFPLLGMLGTVYALIPMVDLIGSGSTANFFTALTTTFEGIVCAIFFKVGDAALSYKIEDNEKHTEYLLFPRE